MPRDGIALIEAEVDGGREMGKGDESGFEVVLIEVDGEARVWSVRLGIDGGDEEGTGRGIGVWSPREGSCAEGWPEASFENGGGDVVTRHLCDVIMGEGRGRESVIEGVIRFLGINIDDDIFEEAFFSSFDGGDGSCFGCGEEDIGKGFVQEDGLSFFDMIAFCDEEFGFESDDVVAIDCDLRDVDGVDVGWREG